MMWTLLLYVLEQHCYLAPLGRSEFMSVHRELPLDVLESMSILRATAGQMCIRVPQCIKWIARGRSEGPRCSGVPIYIWSSGTIRGGNSLCLIL